MQKIILKILVFFHTILSIIVFFGLILIFYKPYQLFFIYFFIIVVWSEIVFLWRCPLTLIEDKLALKITNNKNSWFFVNRIIKRYMGFKLPEKLIIWILFCYFTFSIILLFY